MSKNKRNMKKNKKFRLVLQRKNSNKGDQVKFLKKKILLGFLRVFQGYYIT
jgi:hypothetical protein